MRVKHLWAEHRLLFISFALAATVTLFFAVRTVVFAVYWSDPAHRNQPLEPWMTPYYIANSYDLPVDDVLLMLGLTERPSRRPTLDWIAAQKGITAKALISDLTLQLDAEQ